MTRLFASRTLFLAALCAGVGSAAAAQTLDTVSPQTYEPPAHVSFVEGSATLERAGEMDSEPRNMPLAAGDRLRTRNGRVEVLFADGATLHLDANTAVDFQSDELIRLLEGRIRLSIPGPDRGDVFYRVDAVSGWAQVTAPGEYRVSLSGDARSPELELAVLRGHAELVSEGGQTPLRAGERAFARAGAAPSYAYVFNSASWDAFDQWSEMRRSQRATISTQHLPSEVRPYAPAFDEYGDWRYHDTHGRVWYPRVAVEWRPYHYGRWVTMPVYGWTWVGRDPWAWPTHHYGRWGASSGVWFWIPGRTWAPAWVAWAHAPGYIGWSPLGWNNRPLIQINLFTGRDRWHPWTLVPHRYFGRGYAHARSVPYWNIDARTQRSFAHQRTAPSYTARPRGSAPIRVAGRRTGTAVPRGDANGAAPLYTNRGPDGARTSVVTGRPAGSDRTSPVAGSRPNPARTTPSSAATRSIERPSAVPRAGTPAATDRGPRTNTPSQTSAPGPRSVRPGDPGDRTTTRAPGASPSRSRAVPRGGTPEAAPAHPSGVQRTVPSDARAPASRAVPRGGTPEAAPARPSGVQRTVPSDARSPAPSRQPSAVPRGGTPEAAPARPSGVQRTAPPDARPPASRAVPRGGTPEAAPARPSGGQRTAPPDARPPASRAVPRGGTPEAAPARPSGGQRTPPSGARAPAQSTQPPASSGGGSNRGAAAPGSRSRGNQPSRGAATRRGGGD